jgi:hypothetical protein
LRTSLIDLSPPMRRCCYSSESLTLSVNAWAACLEMSPQVTQQGPSVTAAW